jgi:glycosyltransferase involved in cell wall biosynthesis
MNILFNCTTNIVGGGLKNSAFFIKKAIEDNSFNWHFAVCRPVYSMLEEWELNLDKAKFTIFENSPSRNINARKDLRKLSESLKIDLVYTMAGPAFVKFPCSHLQGISNGYITHADWESFRFRKGLVKTLKDYAHVSIQFFYTLKASDFVFQTKYAKDTFKRRSKIKEERLNVISNAFDLSLRDYFNQETNTIQNSKESEITILCPGAGHLHKGFQFIPEIAKELKNISNKKFKFVLTLPFDSQLWLHIKSEIERLNLKECITNHGPYKYTNLKNLLKTCNIVFVPSLLETFSASYLEAMCAKKKLVAADKNFAREVCRNYATYIKPQDGIGTAKAINEIFSNINITKEELALSNEILSNYGNQDQRFEKIKALINNLISN